MKTEQAVSEAEVRPIFKSEPREGGYTFVTAPDFPGFNAMLAPGESIGDEHIRALIMLVALDTEAAARVRAPQAAAEGEVKAVLAGLTDVHTANIAACERAAALIRRLVAERDEARASARSPEQSVPRTGE